MIRSSSLLFLVIILIVLALSISNPLFQRITVVTTIGLLLLVGILVNRKTEESVHNEYSLNSVKDNLLTALKHKNYINKIMTSMVDALVVTDSVGKIETANQSLMYMLEYTKEEIVGMPFEIIFDEKDFSSILRKKNSREYVTHIDTSFKSKSNKKIPVSLSISNLPGVESLSTVDISDTGGTLCNIVCIAKDITVLKQSERELIKSEEKLLKKNTELFRNRQKLELALNTLSSLILNIVEKKDLNIRFENPNLKKCYEVKNCGIKNCPCYGKDAIRCWHVAGSFCDVVHDNKDFKDKYDNCSSCNVFQAAISDPIYEIGEHFNNMMYVLEQKNEDLETAYRELKETQSQMLQSEKMASIGQLAAGVAHEINNPIGFVSSNLNTLASYTERMNEFIQYQTEIIKTLKKETRDEMQEKVKKLKLDYILKDVGKLIEESTEGTDRVKKIVQNLKSFSRIDEADYKHADLNQCIESTLNIVWNELKYKTTVEKDYGVLPLTKCYPQQMNQVFMNLLVNAAHAIEKHGVIKIKTWNGDGTVNISISDSGCGISEDTIKRVFEPFFTTKEAGKGTGLGLSIAYDIVIKHGGEITIESEVGKGSTFFIKLPVID